MGGLWGADKAWGEAEGQVRRENELNMMWRRVPVFNMVCEAVYRPNPKPIPLYWSTISWAVGYMGYGLKFLSRGVLTLGCLAPPQG